MVSQPLKIIIHFILSFDIPDQLKKHKLDTSGRKDVLQRRLKAHIRCQKLKEQGEEDTLTGQRNCYYDYYLVIDFEATCDDSQNQGTYRL